MLCLVTCVADIRIKDLDLVFETVAGETRTDFDLTNNILTYTGSCNDKEGNRINISKIDPVDVMVFCSD